jgi:hypothetical protein
MSVEIFCYLRDDLVISIRVTQIDASIECDSAPNEPRVRRQALFFQSTTRLVKVIDPVKHGIVGHSLCAMFVLAPALSREQPVTVLLIDAESATPTDRPG